MGEFLRQLDDPEIDKSKISSRDHFELVYIRHRYFRRSENPAPGRLEQFEEMITNISNKIYFRNTIIFKTVGMEKEDLVNIARVHTVSFISMGGLYENPKLMEKFTKDHKKKYGKDSEPSKQDIFRKECYNLSRFLNQRVQEVARFSKVKNANIRGTKNHKKFFVGDPSRSPTDIDLYNYPDVYGYKKITEKRFKEMVKENNVKGKKEFLNQDNEMVRAVYIKGSILTGQDVEDMGIDPRDNSYYRDPEEEMVMREDMILQDFVLKY